MPRSGFGDKFFAQVSLVLETLVSVALAADQHYLQEGWESFCLEFCPEANSLEVEVRFTYATLLTLMARQHGGRFCRLFALSKDRGTSERRRQFEQLRAIFNRLQALGYAKKLSPTFRQGEHHYLLQLPALTPWDEVQQWLETRLRRDWQRLRNNAAAPTRSVPHAAIVGRRAEINRIKDLVRQNVRLLMVYGCFGIGKSVLVEQVLGELGLRTIYRLPAGTDQSRQDWLQQAVDRPWVTHLQQTQGAVVIEGFHHCLDDHGYLRQDSRGWLEFLQQQRFAAGWLTLITCNRTVAESKLTSRQVVIGGLRLADWQLDWQWRGIRVSDAGLEMIHRAYGGHPKAMRVLANVVSDRYGGDADLFWEAKQTQLLCHAQLADVYWRPLQPLGTEVLATLKAYLPMLKAHHGQCRLLPVTVQDALRSWFLLQNQSGAETLSAAQLAALERVAPMG